jgi:hypothetical protein
MSGIYLLTVSFKCLVFQPDPNDCNTTRNNSGSNNVVLSNNVRNSRNSAISGSSDLALTEEEMAFMNEHMPNNSSPGDSGSVGERVSSWYTFQFF